MAILFDTLRFVERLRSSGIPEGQALARAEALSVALGESVSASLATNEDIDAIKIGLAGLGSEFILMRWLWAVIAVGVGLLVAGEFFA